MLAAVLTTPKEVQHVSRTTNKGSWKIIQNP